MTKETLDEYHDNLMNDWLKYMSCWSSKTKPPETPKENVEKENQSPKHKDEFTPQYFYDISTNLFIPPSHCS